MEQEVEMLIRALYQTIGNKVYLRSLEATLRAKIVGLSGREKQDFLLLARDLLSVKQEADSKKRGF